MHRLGVSTRRKYGEELLESWPIDAFVKGFEISFLTISFVLKTNDSPNQSLESLVSNFSDFRLDSLLEDARYSHLHSLLCRVRWKRVFFFSAGTVLVSRIFLIPMIKKKKKNFIFFISKRNKTNFHATRWREFEPSGIGSSRLVSIGEFQFKSMPCSKNQSSSSTDRYIGAKFMNRAPINQYYRVAVVKIADSFLLKGSRA